MAHEQNNDVSAQVEQITNDLAKLVTAKQNCEQCINAIGTDQDNESFRQSMTLHIREAITLCQTIKRSFNKLTHSQSHSHSHTEETQALQQKFITLHSELKQSVSTIKTKSKQFEPQPADKHKSPPPSSIPSEEHLNDAVNVALDAKLLNVQQKEAQSAHNDLHEKQQLLQLQQEMNEANKVYESLQDLKQQQQQQQQQQQPLQSEPASHAALPPPVSDSNDSPDQHHLSSHHSISSQPQMSDDRMEQPPDVDLVIPGAVPVAHEDENKRASVVLNADDPNIVVKEILKEGWLDKKSRYLKSWRRRWVVLDKNTEDITLFTFKHEKEYKNPTETVIINDDIEIELRESTETEFIVNDKQKKAKFIFKAAHRDDRKAWIDLLHWKQNENKNDPLQTTQHMQHIQNIVMHQDDEHAVQDHMKQIDIKQLMDDNNAPNGFNLHVDDDDDDVHHQEYQHDEELDDLFQPGAAPGAVPLSSSNPSTPTHEEEEEEANAAECKEENPKQATVASGYDQFERYDVSHQEVQDCLLLIDDLSYIRQEENIDSENNKVMTDFETSLKQRGYVTKSQMNQVKDVSIRLIGSMFDQPYC